MGQIELKLSGNGNECKPLVWGGNAHCRYTVTHSPRGSVFRDPDALEAAAWPAHAVPCLLKLLK
jgi:hypothetical protein